MLRERLDPWRKTFQERLDKQIIDDAIETAEWCYLAFAVFEQGAEIETGYPKEALISATRFGIRPAHRPPTAQPTAYAAYYLEQKQVDRAAIHEYVEALLKRTLDQSELRKQMAPIRKRLSEAAAAVSGLTLRDVTEDTIKNEATEIETIFTGTNQEDNRKLIEYLRRLNATRLPLLQRIKSGEFIDSPPVMVIGELKLLSSVTVSGEALRLGGVTLNFPQLPVEPTIPPRGTFICGVPPWYPIWQGGF